MTDFFKGMWISRDERPQFSPTQRARLDEFIDALIDRSTKGDADKAAARRVVLEELRSLEPDRRCANCLHEVGKRCKANDDREIPEHVWLKACPLWTSTAVPF